MSGEKREYVYQISMFVMLVVLVVVGSYRYTNAPTQKAQEQLEEALIKLGKCEELVAQIDDTFVDPDCFMSSGGSFWAPSLETVSDMLDVKLKLIRMNIMNAREHLACHQSS